MKSKKNKHGFTLVEVIISMVIMAIVLYAVIAIFISSGAKGTNVEIYSVAQSLAEGKLEEITARNFSNITSESQSYSGGLSAFSCQVTFSYVSKEALDTAVGGPTDYKKVQVQISHPKLAQPVSLTSLRSSYL